MNHRLTLGELLRLGTKFYLEELKDPLEKEHWNEFAVIDVEQKKFVIDPDRLVAIRKAEEEFGEKLFYIVQIGTVWDTGRNFAIRRDAWNFFQ